MHGTVASPELLHDLLRNEVRPACITGEQFRRNAIDFLDRREQPRMAGDAAHRVGVFVVNLTDQQALA